MILDGRVTLNGQVVRELGTKAGPDDEIAVDGKPIRLPKRWRYVVLNKPAGFVTTRSDPEGRPTIYDLLYHDDLVLHPVGRLDRETQGLLLLTNDGELTHRLTHPSFEIERAYHVVTRPFPDKRLVRRLQKGVELEDGLATPKAVKLINPETLELVLTEGRNREVRRMFETVEREVLLLRRVRYGTLTLGQLKEGKARPLRDEEVDKLRTLVNLNAPG